jgi:hypothetical protein
MAQLKQARLMHAIRMRMLVLVFLHEASTPDFKSLRITLKKELPMKNRIHLLAGLGIALALSACNKPPSTPQAEPAIQPQPAPPTPSAPPSTPTTPPGSSTTPSPSDMPPPSDNPPGPQKGGAS